MVMDEQNFRLKGPITVEAILKKRACSQVNRSIGLLIVSY